MAQVTTGLRAMLSSPAGYNVVQNLLGANRSRAILVREHIRPTAGATVLDIGCGTAELLKFLPRDINYQGFDLSEPYIEAARAAHGDRGSFHCRDVGEMAAEGAAGAADLILAIGLLHHLDDDQATGLLRTAHELLKPGGRLISVDGTLQPGQPALARYLILKDRGQNIRSPENYAKLGEGVFAEPRCTVRQDLLFVPYTHCVLEFTK